MLSNTFISVLFAFCTLFSAVFATEHAHAAAHLARRDYYGDYSTSTSTLSSTKTVYKTVTVKKTSAHPSPTQHIKPVGNYTAPYPQYNSTTYVYPSSTVVVVSSSTSPEAGVASGTGVYTAPNAVSNNAGRLGAVGGSMGAVALVFALLL